MPGGERAWPVLHLVAGRQHRAVRLGVAEGGVLAGLGAAGLVRARDRRLAHHAEDVLLGELTRLRVSRLHSREAEDSRTRTSKDLAPAPHGWDGSGDWAVYARAAALARAHPMATLHTPVHLRPRPPSSGGWLALGRVAHREADSAISGDSLRTAGRESCAGAALGEKPSEATATADSMGAL